MVTTINAVLAEVNKACEEMHTNPTGKHGGGHLLMFCRVPATWNLVRISSKMNSAYFEKY